MTKLVAKPDQLIKRKGKAGLLLLNEDWKQTKAWIAERAGKPQKVGAILYLLSILTTFSIAGWIRHRPTVVVHRQTFVPHPPHMEYYICITSTREADQILFMHEGGIDIGDVDVKACILSIPVGESFPTHAAIAAAFLCAVPSAKRDTLIDFIIRLYSVYVYLHFAYLKINPLVCLDGENGAQPTVHYLDMAAKLDQTAESICGDKWAIARDLTQYDPTTGSAGPASKGSKVNIDRGPPMVYFFYSL